MFYSVEILSWPAESLDLSPIEHVSDIIERQLHPQSALSMYWLSKCTRHGSPTQTDIRHCTTQSMHVYMHAFKILPAIQDANVSVFDIWNISFLAYIYLWSWNVNQLNMLLIQMYCRHIITVKNFSWCFDPPPPPFGVCTSICIHASPNIYYERANWNFYSQKYFFTLFILLIKLMNSISKF